MGDAYRLQHGVETHQVDGTAQRDMDADQHHTQFVVGQHHAHRRRAAAQRRGQRLQHLGVAGVVNAGGGQRLLVQRRGDHRRRLTGQQQPGRGFDAGSGRGTAARIHPAPGQPGQAGGQPRRAQHGQRTGRHSRQIGGRIDPRQRQRLPQHSGGAAQHLWVANHHTVRSVAVGHGPDQDFGADAAGIAHRQQQRLHIHAPL